MNRIAILLLVLALVLTAGLLATDTSAEAPVTPLSVGLSGRGAAAPPILAMEEDDEEDEDRDDEEDDEEEDHDGDHEDDDEEDDWDDEDRDEDEEDDWDEDREEWERHREAEEQERHFIMLERLRDVCFDPAQAAMVAIGALRDDVEREPQEIVEDLEEQLKKTKSLGVRNAIRLTLKDLYLDIDHQEKRVLKHMREMLEENDAAMQKEKQGE
jgi:hypothetical protein